MRLAFGCRLALVVLAAALAVGCGSARSPTAARPSAARGGESASPTPSRRAPVARKADPASLAVIRGWSDTLRSGDVRAAARYFAVPSLLVNGRGADGEPYVTAIRSFAQAVSANNALPCGAQLISARRYGRYINALFRLTDRPGGGCGSGAGATARTNFLIRHGRIVEWIRAPDQPGDNGGAGPSGVAPRA